MKVVPSCILFTYIASHMVVSFDILTYLLKEVEEEEKRLDLDFLSIASPTSFVQQEQVKIRLLGF